MTAEDLGGGEFSIRSFSRRMPTLFDETPSIPSNQTISARHLSSPGAESIVSCHALYLSLFLSFCTIFFASSADSPYNFSSLSTIIIATLLFPPCTFSLSHQTYPIDHELTPPFSHSPHDFIFQKRPSHHHPLLHPSVTSASTRSPSSRSRSSAERHSSSSNTTPTLTNPHIPTRDGTAISSVSKWVAEVNQHHTTSARAKHLSSTADERVYGFASSTDGERTKSSRAEPVVSLGGGSFESLVSSGVASPSASVRGSAEFVQEEEEEEDVGRLVAAPSSTALDTILSFASFHFDDEEEEDVLREEDGGYANMINERIRTASSSSSNVLKGKSTAPSSVQSFDCAAGGEEEVLTSSGSKTVSPPVHGQSQSQSKRHGVVWTIGSSSKKMEEPIQRLAVPSPVVVAVAPVSQIQHKSKFTIGPSRSYASPFGEDSNNDDDDDYSDEGSDEYYSDEDEEDMDEEDEADDDDDDLSTSQPPLRSLEDLLASSASSSSHPSASEWTRRGRTGRSDEHQYGYDMYGYDGYGYQWEAGNGTPTVTTARASS